MFDDLGILTSNRSTPLRTQTIGLISHQHNKLSSRLLGSMSQTVNLAEHFAGSQHFKTLFHEGMELVEETATYLDGNGREDARGLSRTLAMLYGAESMRLTTRLMQLASWLLLQRAANAGEMNRDQLLEEKKKVKLGETRQHTENDEWEKLPQDFRELVERSLTLQKRVTGLDRELYGDLAARLETTTKSPVEKQIDLLSTALGAKKPKA